MKTRAITVMIMLALASAGFGQEKPPPFKIDCTCQHVDAVKLNLRGFSNTKVAPEKIALWPYSRPEINFDGMHSTGEGIVVMGTGFGHINSQANRHELGAKLRKLASSCGANCIAYEISGTEFRVRFLRLRDDIFQKNVKRPQSDANVTVPPEARSLMVSMPRPTYPVEALQTHITGSGMCDIVFHPDTGLLNHVTVLESSGSKLLDDAAVKAFFRWRARPGKISRMHVPFTFTFAR